MVVVLSFVSLCLASVARAQDSPFSHFGTGLAFQTKLTGDDRVSDVIVDAAGFVRVNKRQNSNAGLILEVHQLFQPWAAHKRIGVGPFIGIQAGGDTKVIESIGMGIMFGFKTTTDPKEHSSLNIGIGYSGIISAQSLGSEFVPDTKAPVDSAGKPLPIRYVTHDAGALMMVLSFMF